MKLGLYHEILEHSFESFVLILLYIVHMSLPVDFNGPEINFVCNYPSNIAGVLQLHIIVVNEQMNTLKELCPRHNPVAHTNARECWRPHDTGLHWYHR